MKKRIIISSICIIIAFILCFFVSPIINKKSYGEVTVIRAKEEIKKGDIISLSSLEEVKVSRQNLPSEFISNINELENTYAKVDIIKGDIVCKGKVSSSFVSSPQSIYNLKEGECAYSIPISSLSNGVGNNLGIGDTVDIIVKKEGVSFIPSSLKDLTILSLGSSSSNSDTYSCITLLVTEEQAVDIFSFLKGNNISLILKTKYKAGGINE